MKIYTKILLFILVGSLFVGCSYKNPIKTYSTTIIFKTPKMKFYDRGFVKIYDDYINLQILNLGKVILNLNIYKDTICQNDFKCMSAKEFNKIYLSSQYDDDFLYKLFLKQPIYFKDKQNHILIKVKQ